jgi:hypothetical protein
MKKFSSLFVVALAISAINLLAQTPEGGDRPERGPRGPGGGGPSPIVKALDANKDGKVDAAELANAPVALASLDANHDGSLNTEELQPARPKPPAGEPAGPTGNRPGFRAPLLVALDANRDGTIGADELANAAAALKPLDKNSDGELTADELRGGRPQGERPSRGRGERRRPVQPDQQ